MHIDTLPRFRLTALPTPVEPLPNLTRHLGGPNLLVKRDDQTTLALGGNKTRKLEFLLGDAMKYEADTVITTGGMQSNHCRLTAAAACRAGLRCELVLGAEPPDGVPNGNLLLDRLFGAVIHWTPPGTRDEKMEEVADRLRAQQRRPYVIPLGGSNGVGAVGYVAAMLELRDQLAAMNRRVDHVVFATSSGGTQAGMELGARVIGFPGQVLGISIDQSETGGFTTRLAMIANAAAERIGADFTLTAADFRLNYDYRGGGYGVVGDLEREAIALAARHEGLLVDPVYTARVLGGLIDLIGRGAFRPDETVVFWHTGGAPGLFAYAGEIV